MVPRGLIEYCAASSAVAGTLIGLLFVSITLRFDEVFGESSQHRATASAAFTALANALALSLWALIPKVDLGYPAVITAILCLVSTFRSHFGRDGRRSTSTNLYTLSVLVYVFQFASGVVLIAATKNAAFVYCLAYTVFAAFATGLSRSWQLLKLDTPQSP